MAGEPEHLSLSTPAERGPWRVMPTLSSCSIHGSNNHVASEGLHVDKGSSRAQLFWCSPAAPCHFSNSRTVHARKAWILQGTQSWLVLVDRASQKSS